MNGNPSDPLNDDLRTVIEDLAKRLERVEKQLGIAATSPGQEEPAAAGAGENVPPRVGDASEQESLEFEVGQTWFALIGIVALAIGMVFLLSLPFASFPSWAPSLAGYIATLVIFYLARISSQSFQVISKYLRGSGMLLLFFSTIRLFYFGEVNFLVANSPAGLILLVAAVVLNLTLAWRRDSSTLWIIGVVTGCGAAVASGSAWFLAGMLTALVLASVYAQLKREWRMLAPSVFFLVSVCYAIWAMGNPLIGNPLGVVNDTYPVIYSIPLWILLFSYALLKRSDNQLEDTSVQVAGVMMCAFGFGLFFIHHLLGYQTRFVTAHILMTILMLGIALVFWRKEKSRFNTFIFAMTGYMALSLALLKAFGFPEVFVVLSLQSLVVIATAIYFCSKFIIVANWLIFIGIIIAYIAVSEVEQGMSIGFGIVALTSARILNWQKKRLTLRTEFMRNAYLTIAFVVLPYALYYLAPDKLISVAWLGISLFYYGLFLFFGNRKYRWMGHLMLLLTALYVVLVGTSKLESHYRIIAFLALGSIMLIVSLIFTFLRTRQAKPEGEKNS